MSGVLCLLAGGGRGLSATANAALFYGSVAGAGTAFTSPACVVTTEGGSGSYSYAWTRTSGDATCPISDATAAVVTWSHTFGALAVLDSVWQCVVTDTVSGATATLSGIQVQLERA